MKLSFNNISFIKKISIIFLLLFIILVLFLMTKTKVVTLRGHSDSVTSIAFSKNDHFLFSSSNDASIKVWDINSEKEIETIKNDQCRIVSMSISSNEENFASLNSKGIIQIFSISENLSEKVSNSKSKILIFKNKIFASNSNDEQLNKIFEKLSKNYKGIFKKSLEDFHFINSISFSYDSKILASCDMYGDIVLYNVETGKKLETLKGHSKSVNSISFSRNNKILASGSDDSTIKLWNIDDSKLIYTLKGHNQGIMFITFSQDGKILASASYKSIIKIWNFKAKKEIKMLKSNIFIIKALSISPNNKLLAVGGVNEEIELWDLDKGTMIKTLKHNTSAINSLAFSHDGKILASGNENSTINLWYVH